MTPEQFEHAMNLNRLDAEYSEFIMTKTSARICNGDMLIEAIEGGDHYEAFKEFITEGEEA